MLKLIDGARAMVEACTNVKAGEDILVVAENEGKPMWLGQILTTALESIGGQTWSAIHLDGLMDRITMELDGRCVLREGKLLP